MRNIPFCDNPIIKVLSENYKNVENLKSLNFSLKEVTDFINIVLPLFREQPVVIKLDDDFHDVHIAGDIHGDLASATKIISGFIEGKSKKLIFLGDYVDRGEDSLQTILLLFSFYFLFPKDIILLKGNHEDININERYGFREELKQKYSVREEFEKMVDIFDLVYDYLSLVAITPNGSFCVHGGIPSNMTSIDEISKIPKPYSSMSLIKDKDLLNKYYEAFYQIQWNDPSEDIESEFEESFRSYDAKVFNKTPLDQFLKTNNLLRVVRGHESSRGGYQEIFDGKLIHIFSSEPYFGRIEKAGLVHETSEKTEILGLDYEKW